MKEIEQKQSAKRFVEYWSGKGYEKGESQPFWLELLGSVFGVENPAHYIKFEEQVHLDHTSFIDAYIPDTHVLIEQKGKGKDLRKGLKQSDGSLLTPFQQAQRYSAVLPYSQRPRWIVTCNFEEFLIYDMEKPTGEPESLLLKDLEKDFYRLQFLVDVKDENIKKEMEISIQAGDIVGVLYDELLKQYENPDDERTLKSMNMLCVRLVFCLYAEDSGIFGGHNKFHNYIKATPVKYLRQALIDLFKVLDTKPEDRSRYLDDALLDFPYVNGGLFADENIEIPQLNEKIANLLLEKASEDFDWSGISPTIFGAVFESTLNPETRRKGGMHYTSIENIHKVIDPLFLDELRDELNIIRDIKVGKVRETKIEAFREKLASLTFLDPACGSGNFLTETYMSLRRLENEAIELVKKGQIEMELTNPIKVSIGQFYGIEINDFAVTVAKTALWIAESQMLKETESIVNMDLEFLPLKSYANIVEGNALRIDWESVVPKDKLNYIMGNPPFVGKKEQTKEQKQDIKLLLSERTKKTGILDYVSGWFYLASKWTNENPNIRAALVSTDSICQGEHVPVLWKILSDGLNIKIDFAYKTFKWNSEASNNAEVYCVIVGFSSVQKKIKQCLLYESGIGKKVECINSYLLEAPNVWLQTRSIQLNGYNKISYGSMPIDDGHLILSEDDYNIFKSKEPQSLKYIRKYAGAEELLKGKIRYCIWLEDVSRKEILNSRLITDRVVKCREFREQSNRSATQKLAATPELFGENRQPQGSMIVIPKVSSKHRKYIPILMVDSSDYIINGSSLIIPEGNLLEFGVLSSNVHNAWVHAVAETWGHSYQYSTDIYNNFPFPDITIADRKCIEEAATKIINVRLKYSDLSIAEMYNPKLGILPELLEAHRANDRAVMQAYGFDIKTTTESSCVAELMKLYKELTKE